MYPTVKRAMDVFVALVFLLLGWWLLLLCAAAIKLEEPTAPVTYNRYRVGKDHRLFKMYKFRTMQPAQSGRRQLPTAGSLSRVGSVIRKLSLDELLQLLNVLKGEMSLVGPRPLPAFYLGYFTKTEDLRHSVRPGITGLAQVNGRANLDWDLRFGYDVAYVETLSLKHDLCILLRTVKKVFFRENVLLAGSAPSTLLDFDRHRARQVELGSIAREDLLLYADEDVRALMEEAVEV